MSLVPTSTHTPSSIAGRGPSQADWERHKATLSRLYLRQGKTLTEIMDVMARKHGFYASARMFKFRFKHWKLEKSLQPDEVLAMGRVQARRQTRGVGSDFWRHGRRVSAANFERYLRNHPQVAARLKKHVPEDLLMKGHIEALLPPHIVVLTPSPSLTANKDLHSLENLVITFQHYTTSYLEPYSIEYYVVPSLTFLSDINDLPLTALNDALQKQFDKFQSLFAQPFPHFLLVITDYLYARTMNWPELAQLWLCHAQETIVAVKGPLHPLALLFSEVHQWSTSHEEASFMGTLCDVLYETLVKIKGAVDITTRGLSDEMRFIMRCLGVPPGSYQYSISSQLTHDINTLETTAYPKSMGAWLLRNLHNGELDQIEAGIEVLERCHWWKFAPDSLQALPMASLYLRVGEARQSFNLAMEALDSLASQWEKSRLLPFDVSREVSAMGDLNSVLDLLYELSEAGLEECLEELEHLKRRGEDLLDSIKQRIITEEMASVQLED
ncbi:Clr5 domain-containing protein [Mariannaea sp. PMI_226]|nr:Clr5 domain-containing protein [Mariannaea sp. PMI_226]